LRPDSNLRGDRHWNRLSSTCTTLPSPLSVTERGESPSLGHHHPHHRLHGQHRSPRPVTLRRNGRFAKSLREVLWVEEVPVLYGISFDGRCHSRIITSSHPIADRRTITWGPPPPQYLPHSNNAPPPPTPLGAISSSHQSCLLPRVRFRAITVIFRPWEQRSLPRPPALRAIPRSTRIVPLAIPLDASLTRLDIVNVHALDFFTPRLL